MVKEEGHFCRLNRLHEVIATQFIITPHHFSSISISLSLSSTSQNSLIATSSELKSQPILDLLARFLETDEGEKLQKKINLVYQFNLAPKKIGVDEVVYTVNLKKGEVTKGAYTEGKPDATFSLKDEDFVKLAEGKLNPQIAFMRGALKIKGSLSAAQKFTPDIFPKPSKL